MHEAFSVKIGERAENRVEHLDGFGGSERPGRKDLREDLFGIFRDGVEEPHFAGLATPIVEEAHHVRMREGCRGSPAGDASLSVLAISRNELDGGFPRAMPVQFRQEDSISFRAA
jgi:hypothetical protein